ncbi:MAG: cobalamin B12-binding domain-containing protein [Chloroflexi bacterium]|nr:cobalamin B12-binding domain-containing protein [Chloroflexota bacterium]
MLRVTLVNPPQFTDYPQPPIGLALLAAVLEKQGYQVTVVDANALGIRPENIPAYVQADVVGLTAVTPTASAAITAAYHLKLARPDVPIILGGVHATLLPEATLSKAPAIDVIVRGEGEETIVELLQALEGGGPLEGVAGITYRSGDRVVSTAERPLNKDLDSLPFLAYHLLPWRKYRPHPPHGRAMPFAAVVTSRGCPYHCAYCSKPIFGNRFRAQSPERVLYEVDYLMKRFGAREIAFYDDVFTVDKKRARAIADGIVRKGIKLTWTCETRVNLVDAELLRSFRRAGCYAIAYGIESASREILEVLDKGITLEQVEQAVSWSRRAGLQTIGYFMVGSPGETPETIQQTIDFAKRLKLDFAQFSVTTPFPGTKLNRLMGERGQEIPWESLVYSGADEQLSPVFESSQLSRDDLKAWTRRAYREFYLRPEYLWQRLKTVNSLGALKMNLKGFGMLLRSIVPSRS